MGNLAGRSSAQFAADASGPMSAPACRTLVGFLLASGLVLVYSVTALYSVQPNEKGQGPAFLADEAEQPKDRTQPYARQISPLTAPLGAGQAAVQIYGYNFQNDGRPQVAVKVNGSDRQFLVKSDHLIIATLEKDDLAAEKDVAISVLGPAPDHKMSSIAVAVREPVGRFRLPFPVMAVSEEVRLILLVLCAGALGSYIHALKSLADYIGNRTLAASWFIFYLSRPFLGMGLALLFYGGIRGGFLVGAPADVKSINPFGVLAIAGLVGMFSDKASQKLAEIFETLFRTDEKRKDKLVATTIAAVDSRTAGDRTREELRSGERVLLKPPQSA